MGISILTYLFRLGDFWLNIIVKIRSRNQKSEIADNIIIDTRDACCTFEKIGRTGFKFPQPGWYVEIFWIGYYQGLTTSVTTITTT